MNETDGNMITITLNTFIDGVNAKRDLDRVRALVCEGNEYCSDAIKVMLGIPVKKEE